MNTQSEYRTCPECGELFRPAGKGMYCGPVCRNIAKGKRSSTRGFPDPVLMCPSCKNAFQPTTSTQRRCRKCIDNGNEHKCGSFLILRRDNFQCIYCGLSSIEDSSELHVDHITPRAKGGTSKAGNLVTSCKKCNLEKGARLLSEKTINRIKSVVLERNKRCGINNNKTIKLRPGDDQ